MEKTIKLSSLKADVAIERDGEWVPIKSWPGLGDLPGLAFKVRSTNFPAYLTAKTERQVEFAQKYNNDPVPVEEVGAADGELAADHLLLDWRGLDEKYHPVGARQLLASQEGRLVRNMVYWCAGQVGKRQVEFLQVAEKN